MFSIMLAEMEEEYEERAANKTRVDLQEHVWMHSHFEAPSQPKLTRTTLFNLPQGAFLGKESLPDINIRRVIRIL